MRQVPMLFSPEMMRAHLDGRKTETRRLFREAPENAAQFWRADDADGFWRCTLTDGTIHPFHLGRRTQAGDLIWCRETWAPVNDHGCEAILYLADDQAIDLPSQHADDAIERYNFGTWINDIRSGVEGRWYPSIHMPKWASRLTLRVTGFRIERLHDMTQEAAIAEGVRRVSTGNMRYWENLESGRPLETPKASYASLWNRIYGPDAWDANPWVTVTRYEPIWQNVLEVAV